MLKWEVIHFGGSCLKKVGDKHVTLLCSLLNMNRWGDIAKKNVKSEGWGVGGGGSARIYKWGLLIEGGLETFCTLCIFSNFQFLHVNRCSLIARDSNRRIESTHHM